MSVDTEEQQPIRRRFAVSSHYGTDKVISDEVRRQGHCKLSRREIARRADVSMRSVDRRLAMLADAGTISITKSTDAFGQSAPNIVRITSSTWLALLGLI